MKLRGKIGFFLVLLLSLTLLFGSVQVSAEGKMMFYGSEATVYAGERVTVDVSLRNNTGLMAFWIYIEYDGSVFLNPVFEINRETIRSGTSDNSVGGIYDQPGKQFIFLYDTEERVFNGPIFSVSFDVAANAPSGTYKIQLDGSKDTFNSRYEQVPSDTEPCTIHVVSPDAGQGNTVSSNDAASDGGNGNGDEPSSGTDANSPGANGTPQNGSDATQQPDGFIRLWNDTIAQLSQKQMLWPVILGSALLLLGIVLLIIWLARRRKKARQAAAHDGMNLTGSQEDAARIAQAQDQKAADGDRIVQGPADVRLETPESTQAKREAGCDSEAAQNAYDDEVADASDNRAANEEGDGEAANEGKTDDGTGN